MFDPLGVYFDENGFDSLGGSYDKAGYYVPAKPFRLDKDGSPMVP